MSSTNNSQKATLAPLQITDWGRTEYADALEKQKRHVDQRRNARCPNTLIFTEHEPTYTIGQRKDSERHLIWTETACQAAGISIIRTNRGGDITYHGPGQIVGYPIISLQQDRDLHKYLRNLEAVVIRALAHFGLNAARREGKTGIWLEERKICAIGVAVRTWITYHGFALNVNPNMRHFHGIIPCGITDGTVTSMEQELKTKVDLDAVKNALAVEFRAVFQNTSPPHGQT